MNTFFKLPLYMAMGAFMATSLTACSDDDETTAVINEDEALKAAVTPYVDNNVVATYKTMADEAIEVSKYCALVRDTWATDKEKASEYNKLACEHWKKSREAWEKSESFLYGAAGDYDIDPHIDSWPLDQTALDKLLNNQQMMNEIGNTGGAYVSTFDYGLLGFHALEYILFQLTSESTSEPRDFTKTYSYSKQVVNITQNHLIYMAAVAEDLRNQCIRLEAAWAGIYNITSEKKQILTENNLLPDFDYGTSMKNAGTSGSKYQSYTLAAQEIITGCIDIVDEVGTQKIGRPNNGTSAEDKSYIESPYALNSIVDFADNIVSVQNSYEGVGTDISVSDYIASVAPDIDKEVKVAIQTAIAKIKAIPEPFALNATGAEADAAIEALETLSKALTKANDALLYN
ncbi:imelysin family protein [uncultured Bacteroides sp.]|uniref:imelysin family protein n=1 Tax=uncultured Bacteroides sp. TaxID=162156 RepID=UPI0026272DD9|nr:imelysin family protein [uncultured Bacteroides sp.]